MATEYNYELIINNLTNNIVGVGVVADTLNAIETKRYYSSIQYEVEELEALQKAGVISYEIIDKYAASIAASGVQSGASLDIYDEGVLVLSNVEEIDFKGASVAAVESIGGNPRVIVYVPPLTFVSHLGTTDGINDGRMQWMSTVNRYVSAPTVAGTPYYTNGWDDGSLHPTILTPSFSGVTTVNSLITDMHQGVITCDVTNGNVTVYSCSLTLNGTLVSQSVTQNNITLNVDNKVNNGLAIEGRLRVTISLATILGAGGGYFNIDLEHDFDGGTTIWTDDFGSAFWDRGILPTSSNPTVAENSPLYRYLSGVRFYTDLSTFDISAGAASNEVNSTIDSDKDIVNINVAQFNTTIGEVDFDATSISGLSATPVWNETPSFSQTITVGTPNFRDLDARASSNWHNPHGNDLDWSSSQNIMIDCYSITSTTEQEYFDDEAYRLQDEDNNTFSTSMLNYGRWVGSGAGTDERDWDSIQNIDTGTAGHVEGLQVFNGNLYYPTINFSSGYLPSSNPNYSGLTGDRFYFRGFYVGDTLTHKNFTLTLGVSGFTTSDINIGAGGDDSTDLRIDIKFLGPNKAVMDGANTSSFPGSGWLHCGKAYNSALFVGANNDGALSSMSGTGTITVNITTENLTTEYCNGILIVKLRVKASVGASKYLTSMSLTGV